MMTKKTTTFTFLTSAVLGVLGLSLFYFLLLWAVTGDFSHPITQFQELQPWMSLLIIGFGVQVGLFRLLQKGFRLTSFEKKDTKALASTGTAMSGASMVACCAHHLAEALPILGVSGLALFFTEYQKELLMLGVIANVAGVLYMSWLLSGKRNVNLLLRTVGFRKEAEL